MNGYEQLVKSFNQLDHSIDQLQTTIIVVFILLAIEIAVVTFLNIRKVRLYAGTQAILDRMEKDEYQRNIARCDRLFDRLEKALEKEGLVNEAYPRDVDKHPCMMTRHVTNRVMVLEDLSGMIVRVTIDLGMSDHTRGQYFAKTPAREPFVGCFDDIRSFAKEIAQVFNTDRKASAI